MAILYFAHVTGSYVLGMSIFSVAYVSSAIFEVPTGIVSDLVGRKNNYLRRVVCGPLCHLLRNRWVLLGINFRLVVSGAVAGVL